MSERKAGWISNQSTYKEYRESTLNSSWAKFKLIEQDDFFWQHLDALAQFAKDVAEKVKTGDLQLDVVMMAPICETKWPSPPGFEAVYLVLRDDGFAYFGRDLSSAILGLGARCKDGKVEFYDQYKDQIDAYIAGDNK